MNHIKTFFNAIILFVLVSNSKKLHYNIFEIKTIKVKFLPYIFKINLVFYSIVYFHKILALKSKKFKKYFLKQCHSLLLLYSYIYFMNSISMYHVIVYTYYTITKSIIMVLETVCQKFYFRKTEKLMTYDY